MTRAQAVALAVGLTVSASAAVAHADETGLDAVPPWAIRIEPGVFLTPDHLHMSGLVGMPPALYLGLGVEREIVGPLYANVTSGVSLMIGWLVGGTVRYAVKDVYGEILSVGIGPLFAPYAQFGSGTFAQIDATVHLHVTRTFGIVIGGSAAWALTSAREPKCGVDTCEAYLARGDRVGSLRLGVDWVF